MKKREKKEIGIAIVISLLFFSIFIITSKITKIEKTPLSNNIILEKQNLILDKNSKIIKPTILEVNDTKYESEINDIISVYDFMVKLREEGKIDFKDKTYSGMGKLIEEMNGLKNNGDKYWIYYVNGEKANIGISNYKINPGDVVSWKYENSY